MNIHCFRREEKKKKKKDGEKVKDIPPCLFLVINLLIKSKLQVSFYGLFTLTISLDLKNWDPGRSFMAIN